MSEESADNNTEAYALHHFHASGSAGLQMRMQNSLSEMNEFHSLTCWRLPLREERGSSSGQGRCARRGQARDSEHT